MSRSKGGPPRFLPSTLLWPTCLRATLCYLIGLTLLMARRKKQFLDDGSSSSSSDTGAGDDVDDHFDANDPDVAAERELFHNPYGRSRGTKRTREQLKDDATYGIWADDNGGSTRAGGQGVGSSSSSNNRTGGSRARGKPDYHKCALASFCPSFDSVPCPTPPLP